MENPEWVNKILELTKDFQNNNINNEEKSKNDN